MVRSENFSFGFTENISKFVILRRDIGEVRGRLHKIHKVCLDI